MIKTLSITLEPWKTAITALKFKTPEVGDKFSAKHPKSGVEHVVTIEKIEPQTMKHPTAIFLSVKKPAEQLHAACSALRFEPVEEVEWKAVFGVKLCEDIEVVII